MSSQRCCCEAENLQNRWDVILAGMVLRWSPLVQLDIIQETEVNITNAMADQIASLVASDEALGKL